MEKDELTNERLRILSFWWMLELFSPQKVPKLTRKATRPADRQVVAWRAGQPLPWEALAPPKPINGTARAWRHTVYLGVYDIKTTYETLANAFGDDPEAYDNRPDGESACAGLLIDHEGRLIDDSAILSSALWAAGRIRDPGPAAPDWMDGFELAQMRFSEAIDDFEGSRREEASTDSPQAHSAESLAALLKIAHRAANVHLFDDLASDRVIIESVAVSNRKAADGADIDFLNSFFLDDLAIVRTQVAKGNLGAGLASYLTDDADLHPSDRVDIVARPEAIDVGTTIDRLPKGSWPANPKHALALSQQFAVNRALNDLGPSAGLMGVNGPPGTGKTTMLRDILAGNVVERARRLAALASPSDAFTDVTHRWSAGKHSRTVRQLRPELTGFEMVVVSANNAAVENITAEIPGEKAIAPPWQGKGDYFGDIATRILQDVTDEAPSDTSKPQQSAWGLVAACLGRKKNRSSFHSAFWFDQASPKAAGRAEGSIPRMQTRLTRWRDGEDPFTPWAQARKRFTAAEKRVDDLIRQRAQAHERILRRAKLAKRERDLRTVIEAEREQLDQIRRTLKQHEPIQRRAEEARINAAEVRQLRLAEKPGLLETLLSLGKIMRRWRTQLDEANRQLDLAERNHREATTYIEQLHELSARSQARLSSCKSELIDVQAQQAHLAAKCAHDERRFGDAYPNSSRQGDRRELRAPWLDGELDAARSDLFIAALRLHQDFLANAARDMLHGLRAACEVVAGNYPHDLEPEKIRAAWQLFFLIVPLVSTTFASFGRMFQGLGSEAIGWLLVDEAGQASPQYAAGAIWRARRTVAVGDPLQLEPVVTLPEKAQRTIAHGYGVGSTWIPPRASVQTLADRVSSFGTMLDQGEDRVWVSAPLRVHRRCDDPMFTLCNRIAYNGLMVNGVSRNLTDPESPDSFDSPSGQIVAASHWADEPAKSPGNHLQPNQIERLRGALAYLTRQGVPLTDIIVISPFRIVADELRGLIPHYPGLRAGTIHTAQGREADVVILVLGGDPAKPGAPAVWASTPNLVNVAASRAKRRLYVIGDRAFWTRHNYFRDLANALGSQASRKP